MDSTRLIECKRLSGLEFLLLGDDKSTKKTATKTKKKPEKKPSIFDDDVPSIFDDPLNATSK